MEFILKLLGFGPSGGSGGGTSKQVDTEVLRKMPDTFDSVDRNFRFHRNTYHTLINIALTEALLIIILLATSLGIMLTAKPIDRFFVAAADGRINQIIPLDTPTFNDVEMFSRVSDAVAAGLTFGFLDYAQRLQEVSPLFSPGALEKLQSAVAGANPAATITQQGLVFIAAVPGQAITILRKGINDQNIYEWVIRTQVEVTTKIGFGTDVKSIVTPYSVTALVQRAKAVEVQRGFVIASTEVRQTGNPREIAPAQGAQP